MQKRVKVQAEPVQTQVTEQDIYEVFQNIDYLQSLFGCYSGNKSYIGGFVFEQIAGNTSEVSEGEVEESRFCVWKCGDIFVKLNGVITSYGDRVLQQWSFVQPKEKVVTVYE